ncbi:hypothetical protein HID58_082848, partial [Brassica napus]
GLGLKNLGNTYFLNYTYTECLDAYFLDVGNVKRFHVTGFCALCAIQRHRCSSRRYYKLYIYALCTSVLFSSRAHRFHLWQEISVLAGSSLRNEIFPDVKEHETSAVDYTAGDMIFFTVIPHASKALSAVEESDRT